MKKLYLCQLNELKEYQTRQFELTLDEDKKLDLFVLKQDGHVRAYLNYCPHLGIPLNWQPDEFLSLEQTHIVCATHGALFELENGLCVSGPCRGESLTPLNIDINDANEIYLVSADK